MNRILTLSACALLSLTAAADNDWLHIYQSNGKINTGELDKVESVTFSPTAETDTLFEKMTIVRDGNPTTFAMSDIDSCIIGTNIPTITINIDGGAEVVYKETFLDAKISVNGYGEYDNLAECDVQIRGRGNSTWNMSKKPYRIKFSKKTSLFGMKKAKNYALIANMIDCTLMRNSIALKIGQMLGMPWTNHAIPVNLIINGRYRGSYIITEKIGINSGSVDIEETEGILFELDQNYDEDYKFKSKKYALPVMVKDPDFAELYEDDPTYLTPSENLAKWRKEFEEMEASVSTSDFSKFMDVESLADYLLVYNFTGNHEPHHPKSVYIYKENTDDIFHMGPLWDFDWAYTFGDYEGGGSPTAYLFNGNEEGDKFFKAACKDENFRKAYAARWEEFKTNIYPELLQWIDEYAKIIEVSAAQNGEIWPAGFYDSKYNLKGSETFSENLKNLKTWLEKRMAFMDSANNWGLYQ
ncbi:MAG: CotH kinase family protein [Clostridium sp.]|nr:CotH kinase family protein [Clostridium sp.]